MADLTPTRGAAQALTEERSFMKAGFGFLDEKRMLLAATLMQELKAWKIQREAYADGWSAAVAALEAAVLRHGLEGVQLYPVMPSETPDIALSSKRFLGLDLSTEPEIGWTAQPVPRTPDPSAEAEACRAAFVKLIPIAARMAARQANVRRLIREYRATERRSRALENVLLPETEAKLASIIEHLDEAQQEEAIRLKDAVLKL